MKKCTRCKIVFHDDDRARCLYCETPLRTVDVDDSVDLHENKDFDPNLADLGLKREKPVLKEILKDWQLNEYLRVQYMVGTYFKVRTLKFMYSFSRNHFRMGKTYKRILVQPLNLTSFLIIPWAVYDILDTVFIRLTYNAFCLKCGWKFRQIHATQEHDATECEYNQEYSRVVNDIVTGNIAKSEGRIKQEAYTKIQAGKQSAYRDLCLRRRSTGGWFFDVLCVWISVCLIVSLIVVVVFPFFLSFSHFLNSDL